MVKKLVAHVRVEMAEIGLLLETYSDLLERVRTHKPNLVEVTALAAVVHSFYNGLENIFLSIAKDVDEEIPTGSQWHRDLLARMTMPTAQRAAVLTGETAYRLDDYLGFRHFYRHSYSFKVEWGQLEKLVTPLTEVWADVKEELHLFLEGVVNGEL